MSDSQAPAETPETQSTPEKSSCFKTQYPILFRLLHWALVVSVLVLILTGFSLHAGSRPGWSILGGKVPWWLWTGRPHYWHALATLIFTPAIIATSIMYVYRRVYLRPTHIILFVSCLLAMISGYFLTNPPASDALYYISLWTHAITGLLIVACGLML